MSSDLMYYYRVIPIEPHLETPASSPLSVFFGLLTAAQRYFNDLNNEEIVEAFTTPQLVRRGLASFPASDSLLDHSQEFVEILTALGIPQDVHSAILELIPIGVGDGFGRARSSFVVQVLEVTCYPEAADSTWSVRRTIELAEVKKILATKSSIDALERIVFDDLASPSMDCTICLEEIEGGVEAIKMPCSHVYHANCIVKWLETSHLCPLCRYRMPCDIYSKVTVVVDGP